MFDWLFSKPLVPGSVAPDFTLKDGQGQTVRLADYRGRKNVVLVWYPGDDTRTCTQQLCEFRDAWEHASARDTVVFGVNGQSAKSHEAFRAKFNLGFPLLVDPGQRVGALYQTRGLIAKRTVYLIGKSGLIRYARRGKPAASEVLAAAE